MLGSSLTGFQLVTFVVGVLLPILVALVTKEVSSARTKSILLLVLSGVAGVLNEWLVASGSFQWEKAVWDAMTVFVIGVATLFGLWKPTGINDVAKRTLVK